MRHLSHPSESHDFCPAAEDTIKLQPPSDTSHCVAAVPRGSQEDVAGPGVTPSHVTAAVPQDHLVILIVLAATDTRARVK